MTDFQQVSSSSSTTDPKMVGQKVRALVHSLDRLRRSEAYWHVGQVVSEVRGLVGQAWTLLYADDGPQALMVLEATTKAYLNSWEILDDSDGEASAFFQDLTPIWTEAILSVDLSAKERKRWAKTFQGWQEKVGIYGVDEVFQAPHDAVLVGWDIPALREETGTRQEGIEDEDLSFYSEVITTARLNILERRKQYQQYLALAKAEGEWGRYVSMLVKQGQVQEALMEAQEYLSTIEEVLLFANTLYEQGEHEYALMAAENAFNLPGDQLALATWLRDHAAAQGNTNLALSAAEKAFRQEMSLENYGQIKKLAGENWPNQRLKLLEYVHQTASFRSEQAVQIFLHEKLVDEAIAAIDTRTSHSSIREVVEAALQEKTSLLWVIQASRKQAEYLMDNAKAQYYAAAYGWLSKAKQAYVATGREEEWQIYRNDLLRKHQLKRKLVPLLKSL